MVWEVSSATRCCEIVIIVSFQMSEDTPDHLCFFHLLAESEALYDPNRAHSETERELLESTPSKDVLRQSSFFASTPPFFASPLPDDNVSHHLNPIILSRDPPPSSLLSFHSQHSPSDGRGGRNPNQLAL